jgi:putative inorganic carbon (hco3(-)) transporter
MAALSLHEPSAAESAARDGPVATAARALLLLLIFSTAFMQPSFPVAGFAGVPTDLVFLPLASAFAGALVLRQAPWPRAKVYWLLAAYFSAMLLSALLSGTASIRTLAKLASQVYLLSLPVIVAGLIRDEGDLRRALRAWLAGTAVVGAVCILALFLFYLDPGNHLLSRLRSHFGTLPPGMYPRFRLTFLDANMLCNYLTVSLCILFVSHWLGWVARTAAALLLAGILLAALFTISPGLGGIFLAAGLWFWLCRKETSPKFARLVLAAGVAAAILFVAAMTVTPIIHPTAPFLIHVPGTDLVLAPAGRLMIWMDAFRNFLADPFFGRGIGEEAVVVRYLSPSGRLQRLTDAHNSFLHLAVQCGIVGLAAFVALLAYMIRRTRPLSLAGSGMSVARVGLGLAILNGFAYQGLGASFEDARHLWVLFGLFIAAVRLDRRGSKGSPDRAGVAFSAEKHSERPPA